MADSSNPQWLWQQLRNEADLQSEGEPLLRQFFQDNILAHDSLSAGLSFVLASKLASDVVPVVSLQQVFEDLITADVDIIDKVCADLLACHERDPACDQYSLPFLYFKGFQALQAYRMAHALWQQGRRDLALFLQNAVSVKFDVDIHPAAQIGKGIMIDHATGVVIGETSVIGDNVSILHSVTLGGSGCGHDVRHPKVGDGVLISTGAKLLGNIQVGEGAKIAAGSLVLSDVAAHTTVAGVPARVVGRPEQEQPALDMNQQIDDM